MIFFRMEYFAPDQNILHYSPDWNILQYAPYFLLFSRPEYFVLFSRPEYFAPFSRLTTFQTGTGEISWNWRWKPAAGSESTLHRSEMSWERERDVVGICINKLLWQILISSALFDVKQWQRRPFPFYSLFCLYRHPPSVGVRVGSLPRFHLNKV